MYLAPKVLKRLSFFSLYCQLCFDYYDVYNEIIINLRMTKQCINTFQQYVAAILAPTLQSFHAPQFKNPGSRENRESASSLSRVTYVHLHAPFKFPSDPCSMR